MTDNKKGIHPIAAGVVGAVIGAAGATAVQALSKQENQKKVQDTLGKVKNYTTKALSDLHKTKSEVEDRVEDTAKSAKTLIEKDSRKKYNV